MKQPDYIRAHKESSNHREGLAASACCGCFYCLAIFDPAEINRWIDHESTALCPQCGIDSVIGSASGYPVTKGFLRKMQEYWFGEAAPKGNL
jgi:hypothetical protein